MSTKKNEVNQRKPEDSDGDETLMEWLIGGGELGDLIRSMDWSKTPLGSRDRWPQSLRTTVNLVVESKFPMALLWGPELILLYNDAYRIIAGDKHPNSLGRSTRVVWPEVWHINEPIFTAVMERSETFFFKDKLFPIDRRGSREDAYFTLSYSPVYKEEGTVGGALVTLQETTEQKQFEQELRKYQEHLEELVQERTKKLEVEITERKRAEETINREQKLLQSFINSAGNAHLVYLDRDFNFVRVNETYAATCGYRPDEMIGKNHFALYPHAENEAIFARVRDTGESVEFHDKPFEFPDQPERGVTYWDWTLFPVKDQAGQVSGLIFSLFETTARKRAELDLQRSEERYRLLVEQAIDGIFVSDATGHCLDANKAGTLMLGYSRDELLELTVTDVIAEEEIERISAEIARLADGQVISSEWRVRRKDGSFFIGEALGRQLPDGRFQAILRDITERKQVEEILQRQAQLLHLSYDAVIFWQLDGCIESWNRGAEELYGFSEREALGRVTHDLLKTVHPIPWLEIDSLLRQTGRWEGDLRHYTKEGREVVVSARLQIVLGADGIERVLEVNRDITKKKAVEKALLESEQRLNSVLESMPDAFVSFDSNLRYTYLNTNAERLQATKREELLGREVREVYPDAESQKTISLYEQVIRDQVPVTLTSYHAGFDRWVEVRAFPTPDGVSVFYKDVSDQVNAEEALREATRRFQTIFDNAPVSIYIKDRDGRFVFGNRRLEHYTGISIEHLLGRTDYDFAPKEDADRWRQNDLEVLQGQQKEFEEIGTDPDGRPYINISVKFPLLDVTGTPMEICGISTDITDRELAKEALRESEDRYRRLFENLNSAFLLCQPILNKEGRLVDLKYLMANPAVSRHLNKEPEEMVSKLYSEVFHYTAPNPVFNIYEQVLSTGEPYKGEILLPALNRHYDMAVFCPAKGQLALVLSDITEAKQAEETSIAEAQRLAVVLDAQREISGANLDYGDLRQLILDRMTRLLSADGACLEIAEDDEMVYEEGTGLAAGFVGLRLKTAGSLSGLSMESNQLLRTDDTENDPRVDREACRRIGLRSMIVVPLRYGESLYGVLKLMSARVSAFTADMEQTLRLMGEFLGVTIGRQRALDALRESEEKFRVFAENTDIQIIITTVPEGKVLYTNPSFETMYLYTGGELVGSKTPDLYYNLGEREQILYELQTKGFINSFEMKGKRKDGSWFWNSLTSRVVELDRHKVAITGAVDITARKQAEEALRKAHDELEIRVQERTAELSETVTRLEKANEELEEFAYIASHDLQEPLRKIQTFGDMAKKRCAPIADKTGQDYLDRVLQSAGRMRQLLQELLTLSRVTSQKKPFEKIELNKTVGEAADVFEAVLKETGGKITIENLPTIEADESQMRQLFQNLIGNALKFRDDQIPLVKIHGRVIDQDLCELVVSDSGIGFDPQFAESIFKPFERLHGRSNYEGTGMGLAICRKIVERHGGTIRAESEPGKGTTFFIRLPLKQKEREIH